MERATGIHHLALNVSDIEVSIDFYQTALGMQLSRRWGESPKAAMLDMGDGAMLELFERPDGSGVEGSYLHFALRSDNVDQAYRHAIENGATESVAPKDVDIPASPTFPVRIAFVKGPDGESVELFQER